MTLINISSKLKSVQWPVQNVQAFTTTIHHPSLLSSSLLTEPYGGFNLGLHVGDNHANVQKNRECLFDYFPEHTSIQWLEQVHGNKVTSINCEQNKIIADAVVTREKNLALSIMTADCLPILLSTIDGSVVAAIHAGWKPLAKSIIENTVNKMAVEPESIYAWLGPCIGADNFEVGSDVYRTFSDLSSDHITAFTQLPLLNEQQKYLADLHVIAKQQLNQLGITHIYSVAECTYANVDQYYSYRRTPITGRMATLICSI